MLSPCGRGGSSSTHVPEGLNPFGHGTATCAASIRGKKKKKGVWHAKAVGVVVWWGLAGVKKEWKESIRDDSEGGEGRFT